MLRPAPFALLLLAIACARTPAGPADPIVGKWRGTGWGASQVAHFKKDGTFEMLTGRKVDGRGVWTRAGDEYAITWKEGGSGGWHAAISPEGQLDYFQPGERGERSGISFRRDEPEKPAAETAGGSERPGGEWLYAYTRKSMISSGPTFDYLGFVADGKLRLKNTTLGKDFEQEFKFKKNVISMPTGVPQMPSMDFTYALEDSGKTLILGIANARNTPLAQEWVYFRPDAFLKTDIAGTWVGETAEGGSYRKEHTLREDGLCLFSVFDRQNQKVGGIDETRPAYYRLFESEFGPTLTLVIATPGNLQSQMMRFERNGDELIITPIILENGEKTRLVEEGRETWKLKKN